MRMGLTISTSSIDARIAHAATPGFPVVTRRRLRDAGVDYRSVARRLGDGRMTRLWGDTFVIGASAIEQLPVDVIRRAAVATIEPSSALGGVSAIERLAGWDRHAGSIVVAVVGDRWHEDQPSFGVVFREADAELELANARDVEGLCTVGPVESFLHAARDLSPPQLANAFGALRYHTGLTAPAVLAALAARQRVVGAPRIRAAFELLDGGSSGTKSRSEDRIHPWLVERYGPPLINVRGAAGIPDYEPDFLYLEEMWIVEVDGRHHLEDPVVRAADRARDARLRADGWIVVRIPWWWVWHRFGQATNSIDRAFRDF